MAAAATVTILMLTAEAVAAAVAAAAAAVPTTIPAATRVGYASQGSGLVAPFRKRHPSAERWLTVTATNEEGGFLLI
jgi:hypothetical protein